MTSVVQSIFRKRRRNLIHIYIYIYKSPSSSNLSSIVGQRDERLREGLNLEIIYSEFGRPPLFSTPLK